MSLGDTASLIERREVSPVEVLEAVLLRSETLSECLNCYITPLFEAAREAAEKAEAEIRGGLYRGALHGIPIGVKDNFYMAGVRTTAGSKVLERFVPSQDAHTIARLKTAGAVLTGKLNMHEMALGGTTNNPHYGATHNPWGLDRVPGGSSGGSAAAVAAGLCYAATGSDTAGSIRTPASYCGVVGLKPTYGRCSIAGVVPLAWSLDTVGPLARRVRDAALMLQVMAGYDPEDNSSSDRVVPDFTAELGLGVQGLRLGVPNGDYFTPLDDSVREAVLAAVDLFRDLGASVEKVELPTVAEINAVRSFISRAESSTFNHEWLVSQPDAYGEDVRVALELGELFLARDYIQAQRLRSRLCQSVWRATREFDAVLTPTNSTVAPPFGVSTIRVGTQDLPLSSAVIRLTATWNLSGLPTISVPCGFSSDGLPIGLQITGRAWEEAHIVRIAESYELATDWHRRHPSL